MSTEIPTTVSDEVLLQNPESASASVGADASDVMKVETESTDVVGEIPSFPNPFRHPLKAIAWIIRILFSFVSLIVLLAIIAAIPIVNFLALGYLLELEGRVARTGKLRMAFPLLDVAPKFGSILLGTWLCIIPLRFLSGAAADARLVDSDSFAGRNLGTITSIVSVLMVLHIYGAIVRGRTLRSFLRPFKNIRWVLRSLFGNLEVLDECGQHRPWKEVFQSLRVKYHFSLGVRGFFGALAWLLIPTALFSVADKAEGGPIIVTIFGGVCLAAVLFYLPFLQANFAAENRFGAWFELRKVSRLYRRAPLAYFFTVFVVSVLSMPLYLFKVVLPPEDAKWGVTLVFILSIFPAKILAGWAYHRANSRDYKKWFGWRWLGRTLIVPTLVLYVFILFFTQAIGEHGKQVLFEHHAFLLPVPF